MPLKHSVFTVMMPDYDLKQTVVLLRELGFDGVEWRVHHVPSEFPGAADYWRSNKSTVDVETILDKAVEVRKLTDDQGLEIVALGTYLSYKMIDEIERCMEAANIMGAGSVRVGVPKYDGSENYNDLLEEAIDGFVRIEDIARKYNVRANVEIHPGNICCSASLAYRLVSGFDPDCIGVIADPGNMVSEGYENYQLGLELLGPYLSHLHVKNAAWVSEDAPNGEKLWKTARVSLKEGCVPWATVIQALDRVGFTGWLSLEDFSPGDTRAKLQDAIAYLKSIETELRI